MKNRTTSSNIARETSIVLALSSGIAFAIAGCSRAPEHILDTPRPGAPAYWESSLPPVPTAPDGGVHGTGEEADACTSDTRGNQAPAPDIVMRPPLEDLALPGLGEDDAGDAGPSD